MAKAAKTVKTNAALEIALAVSTLIDNLSATMGVARLDVMDHLLVKEVTTEPAAEEGAIAAVETAESAYDELMRVFGENSVAAIKWTKDAGGDDKSYPALIKSIKAKGDGVVVKAEWLEDRSKFKVTDATLVTELTRKAKKAAQEAFGLTAPVEPETPKYEPTHGFHKKDEVMVAMGRGKKALKGVVVAVNNEQAIVNVGGEKLTFPTEALRAVTVAK